MRDPLFMLILLAMFGVVAALAIGIGQFGRGGVEGAKRSNKMMQLRIALQAVAVALMVFGIWLKTKSG